MKFLFICGSLEEGKDGVGDYTRRLCGALIRKGHWVEILSLCDYHVSSLVKQTQIIEQTPIVVRRIPKNTSYKQRLVWAQENVDELAPDWISLQFVLYSFHPKGLPYWLEGFLKQLKGKHQWQFMFHELWVGRNKNDTNKNRIVSYLQQILIKKLLKGINPSAINTHLPIFRDNLKEMGYTAHQLPLFSNVVENKHIQTPLKNRYKIAFFSQVEVSVAITDFINQLCILYFQKDIEIELIIIGGSKDTMQQHLDLLKVVCPMLSAGFCTGFLNNSEVSMAIQQCDLGITPIPQHALGKSGSIVAFLAHGIPVAAPIVKKEYFEKGIGFFDIKQIQSIVTIPDIRTIEVSKAAAIVGKKDLNISKICQIFLNNLIKNLSWLT